nr:hypothetical protein gadd7.3 - long-tailed hamster [Cricetulus longicaudatus]
MRKCSIDCLQTHLSLLKCWDCVPTAMIDMNRARDNVLTESWLN